MWTTHCTDDSFLPGHFVGWRAGSRLQNRLGFPGFFRKAKQTQPRAVSGRPQAASGKASWAAQQPLTWDLSPGPLSIKTLTLLALELGSQ